MVLGRVLVHEPVMNESMNQRMNEWTNGSYSMAMYSDVLTRPLRKEAASLSIPT
ncbi:hypothetical protein BOTBODRAFT_560437 [Botryobasidium botryosum FD-172 SS1]|uniref:Uncharacterized protein n=1 Tax=Botryobasidium botryosum (strain FD-172 SS1) TaxID=930990 RepID=A0A067LZ58_BOTB1|nr:hypothetical protein BOTBODRAFT_560437 [Botryobasidium botryosum FD-172 SS1]